MKSTTWLRVSYWTAAIADFLVGISVLIPERVGVESYVHPMGLMSAVAISWGILLLIADRKPYERRWVLIPTMIVVVLLGIVSLLSLLIGVMPLSRILPAVILSILIFSLLAFSYYFANKTKGQEQD